MSGKKPLPDKTAPTHVDKDGFVARAGTKEGFKEFPGKEKSLNGEKGMQYGGDNQKVADFFMQNSNADELISGMNEDQKEAFKWWTQGVFMAGQQYDGWDGMGENWGDRNKWYTQQFDDVIDRATLNEGVVVARKATGELLLGKGERFFKGRPIDLEEAYVGKEFTVGANMSFGAANEGLSIRSTQKEFNYVLRIPGGTTGAGMWLGDERVNELGSKQREFITNRDIVVRVKSITPKTEYKKDGYTVLRRTYTVELEYVGRKKHDYGTTGRMKQNPDRR